MNIKSFFIQWHDVSDTNSENTKNKVTKKLESKEYQKQTLEETFTVFPEYE